MAPIEQPGAGRCGALFAVPPPAPAGGWGDGVGGGGRGARSAGEGVCPGVGLRGSTWPTVLTPTDPAAGALLVGTPLVGTPLVGTPLVGTPLVGTPLLGTPAGRAGCWLRRRIWRRLACESGGETFGRCV